MSAPQRLSLYPAIEPYRSGRLVVTDGHELYFEECGNPDGKPALMVHGGPGGGSNANMRRYHDPAEYRIILFDQRGCGRSTPHASIEANTTWDLVADMERLRAHLGIERWQLLGGSWGSTLALAYAEKHPERVADMILRGIFLLRRSELDWFYQAGSGWIFPEAFAVYQEQIPADERDDMIAAYHERLTHFDPAVQLAAAKAWSIWE
jgi:proline iminopeptidase